MSEASVQVAVRVRPFNEREKNLNAQCCVKMSEGTTSLMYKIFIL
jgi:hypothetical protein